MLRFRSLWISYLPRTAPWVARLNSNSFWLLSAFRSDLFSMCRCCSFPLDRDRQSQKWSRKLLWHLTPTVLLSRSSKVRRGFLLGLQDWSFWFAQCSAKSCSLYYRMGCATLTADKESQGSYKEKRWNLSRGFFSGTMASSGLESKCFFGAHIWRATTVVPELTCCEGK